MNPSTPNLVQPRDTVFASVIRGLSRALAAAESAYMLVAGTCFAAIVLIIAADVVCRYFFNSPFAWSYELIAHYLMVAVFFMAISATQARGQNIDITLISHMLPPRLRVALLGLCMLLAAGFVLLITLTGWTTFADAWESGAATVGAISWVKWPAYIFIPAGAALLTLRLFVEAIANLAAAAFDDIGLAGIPRIHDNSELDYE